MTEAFMQHIVKILNLIDVPNQFKWCACDSDGEFYFYKTRPSLLPGHWEGSIKYSDEHLWAMTYNLDLLEIDYKETLCKKNKNGWKLVNS
jgi:hypothetical protein